VEPYLLNSSSDRSFSRAEPAQKCTCQSAAQAESPGAECGAAERAGVEASSRSDAQGLSCSTTPYRCVESNRPGKPPCRARRTVALQRPRFDFSAPTDTVGDGHRGGRGTLPGTRYLLQEAHATVHSSCRSRRGISISGTCFLLFLFLGSPPTLADGVLVSCIIVDECSSTWLAAVHWLPRARSRGASRIHRGSMSLPATAGESGTG